MTTPIAIISWSFHRLLDFEMCPLRYKMKHIDRIPDTQGAAASRGEAIHLAAEHYVNGTTSTLAPELKDFDIEFDALKRYYKQGLVELEGEWGFDKTWAPTTYKTAWLRMKADAVVFDFKKTHAVVIDYKSGKRFGNELKHAEQTSLYIAATMCRYPTLQTGEIELWYPDVKELTSKSFTRKQALSFIPPFEKRVRRLETETEFRANPNIFSCRWCPYGQNKGGQCPHKV